MKKVLLIFGLLFFVFVLGCSENENFLENNETDENVVGSQSPKGACTEGWKCQNQEFKAYQYANCTWIGAKRCPLGCINDSCR